MKSVLCLVLLPVLVLSSPLSKMELLEKLLENLERRQFEDTTSFDESTAYEREISSTQDMDMQTTSAYDVDTVSTDMTSDSTDSINVTPDTTDITDMTPDSTGSTNMTPDITDMTSDSDMTTPVYDTMTTMYNDAKDMTTPHSEMAPREYIRQATEGVCMLLSFVKGQEKLRQMFGNNGGLFLMTGPAGGRPTTPDPIRRLRRQAGRRPAAMGGNPDRSAPMEGTPDRSAPMGMLPEQSTDESFPWEEAEEKLTELCQLINSYSSEPLQLAEALVEQLGAHMGR